MLFQEPEAQTEYRRLVEREVSQQEGENCSGEPRNGCVPNTAKLGEGLERWECHLSRGHYCPLVAEQRGSMVHTVGKPHLQGAGRPENWGDGMSWDMQTDTRTTDTMCRMTGENLLRGTGTPTPCSGVPCVGRESENKRGYTYTQLTHSALQQRLTEHRKATMLQ